MLSSGANVIIWDKMLSSGANVIMLSSGANVIIWCYHVMLSSGMITNPFFIFPENFTHSRAKDKFGKFWSPEKAFAHDQLFNISGAALNFGGKGFRYLCIKYCYYPKKNHDCLYFTPLCREGHTC